MQTNGHSGEEKEGAGIDTAHSWLDLQFLLHRKQSHARTGSYFVLAALVGAVAGIAAIFRTPLAGTIFAAEVLYSSAEFESEVIIPI